LPVGGYVGGWVGGCGYGGVCVGEKGRKREGGRGGGRRKKSEETDL